MRASKRDRMRQRLVQAWANPRALTGRIHVPVAHGRTRSRDVVLGRANNVPRATQQVTADLGVGSPNTTQK